MWQNSEYPNYGFEVTVKNSSSEIVRSVSYCNNMTYSKNIYLEMCKVSTSSNFNSK